MHTLDVYTTMTEICFHITSSVTLLHLCFGVRFAPLCSFIICQKSLTCIFPHMLLYLMLWPKNVYDLNPVPQLHHAIPLPRQYKANLANHEKACGKKWQAWCAFWRRMRWQKKWFIIAEKRGGGPKGERRQNIVTRRHRTQLTCCILQCLGDLF